MTRSVFYGFGAFVGSITGPTTCAWWADDPARLNWDPTQQVPTDLGKTPEAYRRGLIKVDEIQVDDHVSDGTGGRTQIGPMWPGGTMTGTCWVEATYWQNTLGGKPARNFYGLQGHIYELCTVIDWDLDPNGRRFNGYYAEIVAPQAGTTMAQVNVFNPGTSLVPQMQPAGTWWLDLVQQAMPIAPGFTEIGLGAGDSKKGALFIDANVADAMPLAWPKRPWYDGDWPVDQEDEDAAA